MHRTWIPGILSDDGPYAFCSGVADSIAFSSSQNCCTVATSTRSSGECAPADGRAKRQHVHARIPASQQTALQSGMNRLDGSFLPEFAAIYLQPQLQQWRGRVRSPARITAGSFARRPGQPTVAAIWATRASMPESRSDAPSIRTAVGRIPSPRLRYRGFHHTAHLRSAGLPRWEEHSGYR